MTQPSDAAVRFYLFSEARTSAWNMLRCFGALRFALRKPVGPNFVRAMGCGRGIGFSFMPDFQRYAVLAAGTEASLDHFETIPAVKALAGQARSIEIYDLVPLQGHGAWDGDLPFVPGVAPAPDSPVAVITRARIPWRGVPAFIRHSHLVTARLTAAGGRIFSLGVGELPFIRQATFSVWADTASIEQFAYGDQRHREAMGVTRKKRLFSEELFWRFAVRGFIKRPLG